MRFCPNFFCIGSIKILNKKRDNVKKRQLLEDLDIMANYAEALEDELHETQEKLNSANRAIKMQMDHIEMLNRQLGQQDLYINRYMDEIKVLKRMYRDDLINNFSDKE
jgi:septal ring factor EnvC (AmiA/AmiB activator)